MACIFYPLQKIHYKGCYYYTVKKLNMSTMYNFLSSPTDINECASTPCVNGGICNNLINSYTCTCRPGFAGVNCEIKIDPCQVNPCSNGGTCVTLDTTRYLCNCLPGYEGLTCQTGKDVNSCQKIWNLLNNCCRPIWILN